ncbi:hypothetical protein PPS11_24980 [Pseudomonas putida S11]|nr:hypothetical protein PPS11_24980 [Pseudomonas putida S11]
MRHVAGGGLTCAASTWNSSPGAAARWPGRCWPWQVPWSPAWCCCNKACRPSRSKWRPACTAWSSNWGRRPATVAPLGSAASREQAERLAQMQSVSQQLQRPWQQLFAMLEAQPQDDVALLSLAPDARKGQLRITAEARNLEAMLQYHQRLEASAELSDVSLLNHEVLAAQPEHPVRFTLTATWETGHARP